MLLCLLSIAGPVSVCTRRREGVHSAEWNLLQLRHRIKCLRIDSYWMFWCIPWSFTCYKLQWCFFLLLFLSSDNVLNAYVNIRQNEYVLLWCWPFYIECIYLFITWLRCVYFLILSYLYCIGFFLAISACYVRIGKTVYHRKNCYLIYAV